MSTCRWRDYKKLEERVIPTKLQFSSCRPPHKTGVKCNRRRLHTCIVHWLLPNKSLVCQKASNSIKKLLGRRKSGFSFARFLGGLASSSSYFGCYLLKWTPLFFPKTRNWFANKQEIRRKIGFAYCRLANCYLPRCWTFFVGIRQNVEYSCFTCTYKTRQFYDCSLRPALCNRIIGTWFRMTCDSCLFLCMEFY